MKGRYAGVSMRTYRAGLPGAVPPERSLPDGAAISGRRAAGVTEFIVDANVKRGYNSRERRLALVGGILEAGTADPLFHLARRAARAWPAPGGDRAGGGGRRLQLYLGDGPLLPDTHGRRRRTRDAGGVHRARLHRRTHLPRPAGHDGDRR